MSLRVQSTQFARWIEGKGSGLRAIGKVGPFDRLDPFSLSKKMGILIFDPNDFASGMPVDLLNGVLNRHHDCWDAGTLEFPNGEKVIIYNPTRDLRRRNATLMEELAHIFLEHEPSRLGEENGIVRRSYKKSTEKQAYAVGAAALLPSRILKGARTRKYSIDELAEIHQVSEPLVKYRLNVTGIQLLVSAKN